MLMRGSFLQSFSSESLLSSLPAHPSWLRWQCVTAPRSSFHCCAALRILFCVGWLCFVRRSVVGGPALISESVACGVHYRTFGLCARRGSVQWYEFVVC